MNNFTIRILIRDIAQGYFISRPMATADLPGWIRAWHAASGIPGKSL